MPCYDIEGATVDCNDAATIASGEIGYSAPTDFSVSNPVAAQASSTNGGSSLGNIFTSSLNFATQTIKTFGSTQPSGLRLQVNPTTGQQQYFNPSTGQYVGGPVGGGGLFGSSNSFLLIIVAVVIAFFAFGGRKRLTA